MGSVRDGVEGPMREAPEIVVPTTGRRTALVAGGSVSTRQAEERRNDAANPEVAVHREETSSASVQYEVGAFIRTRDRQAVEATKPEVARLRTPEQQAADAELARWKQREAEKAAEKSRAYATSRIVNAQERRIAEARAACAAEDARRRATKESSGG